MGLLFLLPFSCFFIWGAHFVPWLLFSLLVKVCSMEVWTLYLRVSPQVLARMISSLPMCFHFTFLTWGLDFVLGSIFTRICSYGILIDHVIWVCFFAFFFDKDANLYLKYYRQHLIMNLWHFEIDYEARVGKPLWKWKNWFENFDELRYLTAFSSKKLCHHIYASGKSYMIAGKNMMKLNTVS